MKGAQGEVTSLSNNCLGPGVDGCCRGYVGSMGISLSKCLSMLVSVNGKAVKGSSSWRKKDDTSWLYELSGSHEDCCSC